MPMPASLNPDGGRPILNPEGELKLPCGKCHLCISKRAIDWSLRVRHEISEHNENCFLTLTYNNENLCSQFTVKEHFQKFMKKLRRKHSDRKIKYMVSYEYGTKYFRPHMHAIIFNYTPPNQKFERTAPSGSLLYTSEEIDKLWNKGFHSIGEANEKTAYYIASYALKGKERTLVHPDTGECTRVRDSMTVSKRPAIGAGYLHRNYRQLIDSGKPLPRYYLKQLDKPYKPDFTLPLNVRLKLFKLVKDKQKYASIYIDRTYNNLSTRGDEEAYAKLVIDTQKMDSQNSGLRSEELDYEEEARRESFKNQLKAKRDLLRKHNLNQKEI